jgi:hypothetical protein
MFAHFPSRPLLRALLCGFFVTACTELPAPAEPLADDTAAEVTPVAPTEPVVSDAPPVDPTERIKALRDEAEQLREQAERTFQTAEAGCYHRFLVNRCIDQAKSERLALVRQARALEAEARNIDLAERARAAAEAAEKAAKHGVSERPTTADQPMPDVATPIIPPATRSTPRAITSNRAKSSERAKARSQAARRAQAARRDRERYDARVREYEEKKERDASGR